MERIVLIFSGGLDSTTLLYDLLMRGNMVRALSIDYGQRHGKELEAAQRIAHRRGVEWRRVDLSGLRSLLRGSSQTDPTVAVPEGHYAEESMKKTVVPNRNMMMLSVAVAYAIASDFDTVAYAAHAGDHAIYPDCRPEFTLAMQQAIRLADWKEVTLATPFIHKTKAEIVALGNKLCVPFEWTWTCYNPVSKYIQYRPDLREFSLDWLVGFLEGEGCFSRKHDARYDKYYPAFSISQNEKGILEEIKSALGFGTVSTQRQLPNGKSVYSYEASGGDNCRRLAVLFDGRLKLKKRQKQFADWTERFSLLDYRDVKACGRCGTCVERLEAFELAGVRDPLVYADREAWRGFVKA